MKKLFSLLMVAAMMFALALPIFAAEYTFKVGSEDEQTYIYEEMGSTVNGEGRFNDGVGYVIYEFPIDKADKYARIVWKMKAQFEVSVNNTDPDKDEAWEVVVKNEPTEQEVADGKADWGYSVGNVTMQQNLDKWCKDNKSGKIWVRMADADVTNGWGGMVLNNPDVVFTSSANPLPELEKPKTDAEIAAEKAAALIAAAPAGAKAFVINTESEKPFIYKDEGSKIDGHPARYMDNASYIIYAFDVKAADKVAKLVMGIDNQYEIRVANSDPDNIEGYEVVAVAEQNEADADRGDAWGNRYEEGSDVVPNIELDLTKYLTGKDGKIYVYVGDCVPENGWGGRIASTSAVIFTSGDGSTPVTTPTTTDAGTKAPSTFDAVSVVALVAVAALGTAVVIKKKNH